MTELTRRKQDESFLQYAERLIGGNKQGLFDLDKSEIYQLLYNDQVSSDHARKTLRVLEMTIEESKKDEISNKLHSELNDKDLEDDLKRNYKESVELNKDGSQSSDKLLVMSEENAKDVNFLLKSHGYDINAWELVSARNNIWNVYSKQDGVKTLYSSKIVVKPKIQTFDVSWIKEVLENTDLYSPVVSQKPYEVIGKTLEINLADVHIDKLCGIDETRNEYSTEIGIKRLWQVVDDMIEKSKHYKIKKIIFPFGQDVANIDNMFNTTTKGTHQDVDVKYDVMYKILLKNIIGIVNKLSTVAPVEVIYVGGNHDKITSFTMTEAMYWYYLNNDNVEVDSIFNNRKYRLIGNTLLGLAHGADEKKNIIFCMQNDVPELWGKAKFREYHLSHFHKEQMTDEKNGIIMRWVSSISANDAWTHNSGYVGAQKKGQAFIWDDDNGLETIIHSYI